MKIKQLRMQSFRGISDLTLDFDTRLNVLIGDNGSGKSSILDCLSVFLHHISDKVKFLHQNGYNLNQFIKPQFKDDFLDDDIATGSQKKIEIHVESTLNSLNFQFIIEKDRGATPKLLAQINDLHLATPLLQSIVQAKNIPIMIYYSVKRDLLFEDSQSSKEANTSSNSILDVYKRSFSGGQVVFKEFFEWF